MSRPTKLTDETIAKLAQAVALGATYDLAAQFAGISPATLHRWRHEAEQDDASELHERLVAALESAEGAAVVGWLAKIEKAANEGAWQAAAWKLERRYPQQYGRQVVEHQGSDDNPIVIRRAEDLSDDELAAIIAQCSPGATAPPAGADGD